MKSAYLITMFIIQLTGILNAQDKNNFIIYNDGDTSYAKVELNQPFLGSSYLLVDDSIEVELSKVMYFQDNDNYYARVNSLFGYDLYHRIEKGNIDLFIDVEMVSTPGSFNTISTPGGSFTTFQGGGSYSYTDYYFKKDTMVLQEANYSNLVNAMQDNLKSMEYLNTYNTLGYVKYGLVIGGLGMIVGGLASASKENPPNLALIVGGAIVANIAWIINLIQDNKIEDAIKEYNR